MGIFGQKINSQHTIDNQFPFFLTFNIENVQCTKFLSKYVAAGLF